MQINRMSALNWTGERLTTSKTNEIMIHHLHRYALAQSLVKDKVVLDIASGEGYGSFLIASKALKVIGVDISREAVDHAQMKYGGGNLSFMVGSADEIPISDDSIDLIICFETIEHHDKHEEMMLEFKRVLKQEGKLLISSPDKLHYSDQKSYKNPFHVKELYQNEFEELLKRNFKFTRMFNQNILYGSIIVAADGMGVGFAEFDGNFDKISSSSTLNIPLYNVCLASNYEEVIGAVKENSFFNANLLLESIMSKEIEIYNSKTYRLGRYIVLPYRLMLKIIKRFS